MQFTFSYFHVQKEPILMQKNKQIQSSAFVGNVQIKFHQDAHFSKVHVKSFRCTWILGFTSMPSSMYSVWLEWAFFHISSRNPTISCSLGERPDSASTISSLYMHQALVIFLRRFRLFQFFRPPVSIEIEYARLICVFELWARWWQKAERLL